MEIYLISIDEINALKDSYCQNHFPLRYQKSLSFIQKEDHDRCLLGGYLLYHYLKVDENKIKYNSCHKPYLENGPYFNLSHSGSYVILAIDNQEIGVDIEEIKSAHKDILNIAFNRDEIAYIKEDDIHHFYQLWTIKESVMKATGLGLSLPLKKINALKCVREGKIIFNNQCYYVTHKMDKGYSIAITSLNKIDNLIIKEVKCII